MPRSAPDTTYGDGSVGAVKATKEPVGIHASSRSLADAWRFCKQSAGANALLSPYSIQAALGYSHRDGFSVVTIPVSKMRSKMVLSWICPGEIGAGFGRIAR